MIYFHKRKDICMKRASLSPEDQVRSIHFKYEIPEDRVQAALDGGFRFGDVDQAALLSCLSDASMEDILAMRKDDPWGVIKRNWALRQQSTKNLSSPPGRAAGAVLRHFRQKGPLPAGRRLSQPLDPPGLSSGTAHRSEDRRHRSQPEEIGKWKLWAERVLHVSPEDFTAWIAETRNPSLARKK